jgi:hypothetical protein
MAFCPLWIKERVDMQQSAARNPARRARHGVAQRLALAGLLLAVLGALFITPSPARAATFTVNNVNNDGAGSLRQAVIDANATVISDTINFAIPGNGPHTITLLTPLPEITNPVVIDAENEELWAASTSTTPANLRVTLDGSSAGASATGLVFAAGASNSTVKGLVINRFAVGVEIRGDNVTVRGNIIGLSQDGATDPGTMQTGVYINDGENNTIGGSVSAARNVISGNDSYGVRIEGGGALSNRLFGNYIGTNAAGNAARGNGSTSTAGVYIAAGAQNTVVGAPSLSGRNIISGNPGAGVRIDGALTGGTVLEGNYIGTDRAGISAIPNGTGVYITNAPDTTIGGDTTAKGNLISGNAGDGVWVSGSGATPTEIFNNYVGTNNAGSGALGNGADGILIVDSPGNTIGAANRRNVISGNTDVGLRIQGLTAVNNTVVNNYVGLAINGSTDLGNGSYGVSIDGIGGAGMTLGGTTANTGNVISGNGAAGVYLTGVNSVFVQGNIIGMNAVGSGAVANAAGVVIDDAAENTIGGSATGARNWISGNTAQGVWINGAGSAANVVQGNYIGVNATGTGAVANNVGVQISDSPGNQVGGTEAGAGNLISGNTGDGIVIDFDPGVVGSLGDNIILGNLIGTNAAGTGALGNGGDGIQVGQPDTTIGGTAAGAGNVISSNTGNGINLVDIGASPSNNVIRGNTIGTDLVGVAILGNGANGILINNINNTIGGGATGAVPSGAGNIIANNGGDGVTFAADANKNGSSIRGNSIYNNAGLGIDLLPNGRTNNDDDDPDAGNNDRQNYPVLETVTSGGATFIIKGTFNSIPLTSSFTLDFYANDTCDAGETEGRVYLGSASAITNANGDFDFENLEVPNGGVPDFRFITATATNPTGSTSEFSLCIKSNNRPTITAIADQVTEVSTPIGPINFTIGDEETPVNQLQLLFETTNPALIPTSNIAEGGSGANRNITVTPVDGLSGVATITVIVRDADNGTVEEEFVVTVTTAPTISDIPDTSGGVGQNIGPINFTIGDAETLPDNLILTGDSSNAGILPVANIVFGGSGANRTVTLTPVAAGTVTVTITVNDGLLEAFDTFDVVVSAPPTISNIPNQVIQVNQNTGALPFTVGDDLTAPGLLVVTATSSNQLLVPNNPANIVLTGAGLGADRTIQINPLSNQVGTVTITVTVTDDQLGTAVDTFDVLVNAPPTISNIPDSATAINTPISIPFTIGDLETPPASLILGATSSNTTLVPNGNINFGAGATPADRFINITPAAGQSGATTITVTLQDTNGGQAQDTFILTVSTPPTISDIPNQVTLVNTSTPAIPFTVGDAETPPASLIVTAVSSDQTVVPNANIFLGGTGADRSLTIIPATNQTGTVTITVTVTDSSMLMAADTFQLRVNAPPTISNIANQITPQNTPITIPFTIGDDTTPLGSINPSATSSNQAVVAASGITFGGTGANRTIRLEPVNNAFGTTVITIQITDQDGAMTTETFDLNVFPGPTDQLIRNGGFDTMGAVFPEFWGVFGVPELPSTDGVQWRVQNGVFEFFRPLGSQQGVVLQNTEQAITAGTPLIARFDLGNSSNVRKRITVLVHDTNFTDSFFCTFWLDPQAPARRFGVQGKPNINWDSAYLSFYASSADGAGHYRVDNVEMFRVPGLVLNETTCINPNAPTTPPSGTAGANLLGNGDFSAPIIPPNEIQQDNNWATFATPDQFTSIVSRVQGGVFEYYRPPTSTSGVVFQPSGDTIPAGTVIEARFDLGNSSTQRKRFIVIMHNPDFTDTQVCVIWVPGGAGLSTYVMRGWAPLNWSNGTLSFYLAPADNEGWARLDNVIFRNRPDISIVGTECYLPGAGIAGFDDGTGVGIEALLEPTATPTTGAPVPPTELPTLPPVEMPTLLPTLPPEEEIAPPSGEEPTPEPPPGG